MHLAVRMGFHAVVRHHQDGRLAASGIGPQPADFDVGYLVLMMDHLAELAPSASYAGNGGSVYFQNRWGMLSVLFQTTKKRSSRASVSAFCAIWVYLRTQKSEVSTVAWATAKS